MNAAIIGTCTPGPKQIVLCSKVVETLLSLGFHIHTGAAVGIDELAMRIARERCSIFIPWPSYNPDVIRKYPPRKVVVYNESLHPKWKQSVINYHTAFNKLSQGEISLHARNYGIVEECNLVVAFPGVSGGGTMQGIRVSKRLGIPVITYYESQDIDVAVDAVIDAVAKIRGITQ
jgi:hypothetical protein